MSDFIHFMDAFDASHWPMPPRRQMGLAAVTLVGELEKRNLRPILGHDLHRIARHQANHSDDMTLSPPFDSSRHPDFSRHNTVVVVIEDNGKEIGICGERLFWVENSLAQAIEKNILPGAPVITAPSAKLIVSTFISWSGAAHVQHKDRTVYRIMERLLHLWSLVHWKWQFRVGIAEEGPMRLAGNKIYGFPTIEQGIWRSGREYWLMISPRQHYAELVSQPAYADPTRPLGVPVIDQPR